MLGESTWVGSGHGDPPVAGMSAEFLWCDLKRICMIDGLI